jgi:hypothetical protein
MDEVRTHKVGSHEVMSGSDRPPYSEDGVDLTLIRWMLSLTLEERLQVLQDTINAIMKVRDANPHL